MISRKSATCPAWVPKQQTIAKAVGLCLTFKLPQNNFCSCYTEFKGYSNFNQNAPNLSSKYSIVLYLLEHIILLRVWKVVALLWTLFLAIYQSLSNDYNSFLFVVLQELKDLVVRQRFDAAIVIVIR